jgi:hypothetical protein
VIKVDYVDLNPRPQHKLNIRSYYVTALTSH